MTCMMIWTSAKSVLAPGKSPATVRGTLTHNFGMTFWRTGGTMVRIPQRLAA